MSRKMLRHGALTLLRYAEGGPARVELDPSRYTNYGEQGGEHLFFPDRAIPGVGTFAQPSGLPPPPGGNSKSGIGDYIPLLGMAGVVGKDLYDWWKKKNPGVQMPPELISQIEAGASDVSGTNAWIDKELDQYGQNMPMPWINDDGSVSHIGGDFWGDMDSAARDTTDTDAYVNRELDEYAKNMPMPTAEYDPSLLERGISGGGGALDLYIGSQRGGFGGYGQALKGAGKLGEAVGLGGDATRMLGKAGGALSGVGNVISGIEQGGVQGYGKAAIGAAQTANKLGLLSKGAGQALGKAVPIVNAAISAKGAYDAAKVGDKKGAVTQGAMAGASIGSVIPVVGTAVGAAIGAVVGLVGAAFGNKEMPSEQFYGAYKKLDPSASARGWSEDQINGAMFETIKSHTKSGNINKFGDVREMYEAFGITKDAHKNYKNVQGQMNDFMKGVIQTAQEMGKLPKDPAALRQIDGQQVYHQVIVPAMAAKYKETTGRDSSAWTIDRSTGDSVLQNLFADKADWMLAHWGEKTNKPATGGGSNIVKRGRVQQKARGGLSTFNEGSMLPRRGGLSMAASPAPVADDSSYYRYGAQRPAGPPARPMNPAIRRAVGGLSMGYQSGGPNRLVRGPGTGRSDDIPARLSDGEYVFDAETVALLGDGSTDEGARRLDALRQKLRMHKGKQLARGKFSSAAKNPEEYL